MAAEEDRHWWFRARRDVVLAAVSRYAPAGFGSMLDVGCGTGGNLAALRAAFPEASFTGVDASEDALEASRRRGLHVVAGDASALPVADGSADIVSALDVLEHLDDDRAAVREMARVLRPGGLLVVTVPAYKWMWGPHDELNHHKRRYVRSLLEPAVTDAGLEILTSTHFNTLLFPAAVLQRLVERVRAKRDDLEESAGGPLSGALYAVFSLERHAVAAGWRMPYGLSILLVARKPASP